MLRSPGSRDVIHVARHLLGPAFWGKALWAWVAADRDLALLNNQPTSTNLVCALDGGEPVLRQATCRSACNRAPLPKPPPLGARLCATLPPPSFNVAGERHVVTLITAEHVTELRFRISAATDLF